MLFFTKETDLSGYTGGFTPAHLWFILYLFIISVDSLLLILLYKKSRHQLVLDGLSVPKLLPLFLLVWLMRPILGEFFAYFMLGFLILSEEKIQERLDRNRWYLLGGVLFFNWYKNILSKTLAVLFRENL